MNFFGPSWTLNLELVIIECREDSSGYLGNLPSLKFTEIHLSVGLYQNLENWSYFGDQSVMYEVAH